MASAPRRVTMADVARRAGVSPTTVSFVVNDDPRLPTITAVTQDRVREAIRALDYRPNHAARRLRNQRSDTLGFITDEIAAGPFAGGAIRGAASVAWERGHMLAVLHTGGEREWENAAVEMALDRQLDAVILGTSWTRPVSVPDNLDQLPTVLLDCYAPGSLFTSVRPDDHSGGLAATALLIEAGHRRIGFINGVPSTYAARERERGFADALARAGLAYGPSLIRYGTYESNSGHHHAGELLDLPDPPTALFCANDRMAVGAYFAILERGLSIPDDVSVIGYDNQVGLAEFLSPPLTTIQLPHFEMGARCAELVLDGNCGDGRVHEIACRPVERESVGPPRLP